MEHILLVWWMNKTIPWGNAGTRLRIMVTLCQDLLASSSGVLPMSSVIDCAIFGLVRMPTMSPISATIRTDDVGASVGTHLDPVPQALAASMGPAPLVAPLNCEDASVAGWGGCR